MWQVQLISGQTIAFEGAERYEVGDETIAFLDDEDAEIAFFWRGYVVGVYPADAIVKPDRPMPIEAAAAGENSGENTDSGDDEADEEA
jgi:hypothetical protein